MNQLVRRAVNVMLVISLLLPTILSLVLPSTAVQAEAATASPKREMRAAWISSAWNLDWPTQGSSVAQQQAAFTTMLDELKATGINAIIVQIRPMGDAFYPTSYAPWSRFLTGTQGKDPGYNPLAFMIEEAHKRNLEFHAWFNPFRIADSTDETKLSSDNPAKQHPEWRVSYNGGLYYNPGIPEVRSFIKDTIVEVVRNYDIDAVHLDDYFYPDIKTESAFPDQQTFSQYGAGFSSIGDWRRNNINLFVKDLSNSIRTTKSYVKFGISPNGIWQNFSYGNGLETTGMESYSRVYADSRKWVKENTVDYIAPQVYWKVGFQAAPYEVLLQWWKEQVQGTNVQLYMGHADYKLGTNTGSEDWTNATEEIPNQIALNRSNEIGGSLHFRAKTILQNILGIKDRFTNDVYKYKALIPTMPHKDATPPAQTVVKVERQSNSFIVSWNTVNDASYYAVYRFKKGEAQNINDATKLLSTIRAGQGNTYTDTTVVKSEEYVYAVTAVDRLHNESTPAFAATIVPIRLTVDQPAGNEELTGIVTVKGWTLAEAGVSKIEVLADGNVLGTAQYGLGRLDVYNVYPAYENKNSGFSYQLDTKLLTQGAHTLTVRTTASDGTQSISSLPIRVSRTMPIRLTMDTPTAGAGVSGKQSITGWALAEDGIAEAQVLIDGVVQGNASLGLSRPDVFAVYPAYNNKVSGYTYSLDTAQLRQGIHNVAVRIKTKAGDTQTVESTINVVRQLPIRGSMDTPANGVSIALDQSITGWALAEDGIDRVEVFVDGSYQGKASYGLERQDVANAYPQYKQTKSGYTYTLDTTALTEGLHTVAVRYVTKTGDMQTTEMNVNVFRLPAVQTYIDQPSKHASISGTATVSGWALAQGGMNKIEIFVDGQLQGIAQSGLSRLDVYRVYPQYGNGQAGYQYSLNTKVLTEGEHTLTVRSTATNGKQGVAETTVNVVRELPVRMSVDTPADRMQIAGSYRISGWALAENGIQKVELFVDGQSQGTATLGLSRPDVSNAYPKYNNKTSGYEYQLDAKKLSLGWHTMKIVATAANGDVRQQELQVEVVDLPTRISIDQPANNQAVGQMQTVSGWALVEDGVKKVEILVDGAVKGEAKYGLSRADVAKVYPLYQNSSSGYTYSLDTSTLAKGTHTLTVRVTDTNGKVASSSMAILVSPLHGKTIVIDPGHGGLDSGATNSGSQEKDINLSVGLKLRSLLQQHGVQVIMTRSDDTFIELNARAKVANDNQADAFVSIHVNSATSTSANGIETYYYVQKEASLPTATRLQESRQLAEFVQNELLAATGALDRKAQGENFAVLRENKQVAILVELGFISNPLERSQLISANYQQKEAEAILNGLVDYFE